MVKKYILFIESILLSVLLIMIVDELGISEGKEFVCVVVFEKV